MVRIREYSWVELQSLCEVLATSLIGDECAIDAIVGVSRGGVFPALLLAHKLSIRDVQIIGLRTTTSDRPRAERESPVLTALPLVERIAGKKCLLVDDITNTGLTLRVARSALLAMNPHSIRTAAMVWDTVDTEGGAELTKCEAEFFGEKVHAWAAFPWELKQE